MLKVGDFVRVIEVDNYDVLEGIYIGMIGTVAHDSIDDEFDSETPLVDFGIATHYMNDYQLKVTNK